MESLFMICILSMLFSISIYYYLTNRCFEKYRITKNTEALNYITRGLDGLKERFVLINVVESTYEFLYATTEEEHVMKTGPYSEFISYLQAVVVRESDSKRLAELLPLNNLLKILERTYRNNVTIPLKMNLNGKERWDLLSFIVIERNDGEIGKILLSRRDITETQEKEEQQQKLLREALKTAERANKAKSSFLFNMSHDIRTPMNAIIGFTNMAKKHLDDPEKAMDYLNKVEISSKHMLGIVNDILDMARIDSGKVELESAPIDVYKECDIIDMLFRSSMEERQIDFSVRLNIMDNEILGDAMRIKQIIINLASNAMKYTKPGGKVSIDYIQTGRTADQLAIYEIHIKDTGIGMSEEYQKHLFEAFERERNETVSGIQGTGLGLAISKRLADLMGGTLTCKSQMGVGTEFIFKFKAPLACAAKQFKKPDIDSSIFKGKRVLLVEDNELNREIAVEMLEELELLVEEANDGSVAVERIQHATPGYYSYVLMDIQMPYMDGYRATKEIRALSNKKLAAIPIIAMTANAFEEDKKKALESGMNAHLSKPIDIEKLMYTLCEIM